MWTTRNLVSAVAALAVLALLCIPATGLRAPQPPAVPDPLASVVLVVSPTGKGSGVHIGGGVILTAWHVVEPHTTVMVKTAPGVEMAAKVLWFDKGHDVALLMFDRGAPAGAAELNCDPPTIGAPITAVGNPMGLEFITLRGHLAGKARALGPWQRALVADMTVIGGMSGGPVLDARGRVVAMTVGGMSAGGIAPIGIATVVPADTICALLSSR